MKFQPSALLAAALLVGPALGAPTSSATAPAFAAPGLRISEVLAWNTRLAHGAGFPDLIELHNAGPSAIDLAGKSLTDDPLLPRKFVFPAGASIPAGGHLVVYAAAAAATGAPGLHTGFALDAEGDTVRLLDTPAAGSAVIDFVEFGFQVPDLSISRTGAAGDTWALTAPTSGAPNGPALVLAAPGGVRLNEWAGKITFRLDHDLIELFNPAGQPAALGGVRLTDDVTRPTRFVFPKLSFLGAGGFLPLYGADFVFGLDGDSETVTLAGENNERIDQVVISQQEQDKSGGRSPDGTGPVAVYDVPTPGLPNDTPLPPAYRRLLDKLRITEIMYQPTGSSSDHEFIELHNTGGQPLDLGGVRFTNGLGYTFPAGTMLAPGGYIVVADKRTPFLARYPAAAATLAPGEYDGSLDNSGETIALTLPAPWDVHILRFRYEPAWYPSASGGGRSLVIGSVESTGAKDWAARASWRASNAVGGSPGAPDPATPMMGTTSRLSNLSVRTSLNAGQALIVGVVVNGGWRNVLVRAAGPALTGFGLANTMADPRLELYQGAARILENDDWPASLAETSASVGAFPFAAGSRDAAFMQGIEGARSIQARGAGPGAVLVEAYDTGTGNTPRFVNLSARNRVGTGDDILIAGFNLSGTGMKQLVIRAVGPKLTAFGVAGALADPKLELYAAGGAKIAENDNWTPTLAGAFAIVGAFPLDTGSRDAALIATLGPGSYTAQVRGTDGGTGEALVEIYELLP